MRRANRHKMSPMLRVLLKAHNTFVSGRFEAAEWPICLASSLRKRCNGPVLLLSMFKKRFVVTIEACTCRGDS